MDALVATASGKRNFQIVGLSLLAVVLVISVFLYRSGWLEYERVARLAASMRGWSDPMPMAIAFLAIWGVATSLAFPALPLMVAGGALFGTLVGTALSLVGSALGAIGGYFLARALGPDFLRRRLARRLPLDELSEDGSFLTLLRLRLLPVVPFFAVSYASGIERVAIRPYIASTIAGQFPSTLVYSYFADRLLKSAEAGGKGITGEVLLASLLALLLSFAPRLFPKQRLRTRTNRHRRSTT